MDNLEGAVEKIISFNQKIKKYKELIGGFHMWGKLKTGTGWKAHAGNFDTFFSCKYDLKQKFLESVSSTFDDGIARYFVPEVNSRESGSHSEDNSGVSDFHSIVADMENKGLFSFPLTDNK